MSEIKDLTGKSYNINDCLGCEIAKENILPFGGMLFKNENFVVVQDFELPINGFIIISTIRHIESYCEMSASERIELGDLIDKTLKILKDNNIAKEYNIILEEKKGYHFHIWLMPRHKWMIEKFGSVLKNIKSIQQYAFENMRNDQVFQEIKQTCELLKKSLNN